MRIVIANDSVIQLGKKGENNACQVQFPVVEEWEKWYGEGTFQLLYKRYSDNTPYAVTVTTDTHGNVCWNVTNTDTNVVGRGQCELQYIVSSVVAKSQTFMTNVVACMDNAGTTPPEPWSTWVAEVLAAGSAASASAVSAAASASSATASANSASGYAINAQGSASSATASAAVANQYAQQASSAKDTVVAEAATVHSEATQVATDAAQVATDKTAAQTAKNQAVSAKESAAASATSATNSASMASTSATNAQNSASSAAQSATEIEDLTVTSESAATGEPASVEKTGGSGVPYNLHFKLPRGEKGDRGDCQFATFSINPDTGILTQHTTTQLDHITFAINANGILEVSVT